MSPQSQQKSHKSPQKTRSQSRSQARRIPQKSPTTSPQNRPQDQKEIPQTVPEIQPEKTPSPDLLNGSGTNDQPKEDFTDLINEAEELQSAGPGEIKFSTDPAAADPDKPAAEVSPEPTLIAVKPAVADTLTDIWTELLRIGWKYATKGNGDLLPPTPEQRARFNVCVSGLAEKYLPPAILAIQDDLGLLGVSALYITKNMKQAPQDAQANAK